MLSSEDPAPPGTQGPGDQACSTGNTGTYQRDSGPWAGLGAATQPELIGNMVAQEQVAEAPPNGMKAPVTRN